MERRSRMERNPKHQPVVVVGDFLFLGVGSSSGTSDTKNNNNQTASWDTRGPAAAPSATRYGIPTTVRRVEDVLGARRKLDSAQELQAESLSCRTGFQEVSLPEFHPGQP